MNAITILGKELQTGTYLLRLQVREDLLIPIGRFQQGRKIPIPFGEYIYLGSAMASKGSMTLARRLLRHASRRDAARPQPIQSQMLALFKKSGLGDSTLQVPEQKKLFWNIDYLLEEGHVRLSHVIIIRSLINLEDTLAHFLATQPGCRILEKGLGAHDRPGQTHFLGFPQMDLFWQQLPGLLNQFLGEASTPIWK